MDVICFYTGISSLTWVEALYSYFWLEKNTINRIDLSQN